jgi:hypothetical protein
MATATAPAPLARRSGEIKTLGHAWRDFSKRLSPRLLGVLVVTALAARLLIGGWSWRDAAAAAAMAIVYPFGEWAIHVYLLHMAPRRTRSGEMYELPTSRSHRQHHERPNHLGLILLGPVEVAGLAGLAVPLVAGLGALLAWAVFGGAAAGPVITAVLTAYVLIAGYEWMHFLIHTAYRPKSRLYRQVWHGHRLHHFKNEHYWHGVTNTFADRVLGTAPDQREVERSATARTLQR